MLCFTMATVDKLYTRGDLVVKIKVNDNGPYDITGSFELVDEKGNHFETKQSISLCRCGHSDQKPFCDGTHEEVDFESAPRAKDLMVEV